ncbi:hypothetical protein EDEG_03331 [Edhazardia aedis USNM 41457]|uniref:SMARCC C-terminal domain-containing protein n=1 Tax=Edhazardia aedis (strain USNM 41457) TaxID=1003232 RepID=J8ZR90_EDHAE|nr:hypothetical protein EDEG_03331 [Edhazardia aedis USNM 41457]|eukprot:EJW02213.1 hypothetical protein EDEG_03331 [Edhazardia aedis USNM 41457]
MYNDKYNVDLFFSTLKNPCMSVVSLVSSNLCTRVGADAAQYALKKVCSNNMSTNTHFDNINTDTNCGNNNIDNNTDCNYFNTNTNFNITNTNNNILSNSILDNVEDKSTNIDNANNPQKNADINENSESKIKSDTNYNSKNNTLDSTLNIDPIELLNFCAKKAKEYKQYEEDRACSILKNLIEMQIEKMDLKIKDYEDICSDLSKEKESLKLTKHEFTQKTFELNDSKNKKRKR